MKTFLKNRGASLWLALIAILFGAAAYFLYAKYGITEFSPALNQNAVIALWVGVALSLIGIVTNWKPVKVLAYLAFFYAFFGFSNSQATYVANIFVSIDGTTFSAGFIMTAAAFILAIIVALIAAIVTKTKKEEVSANA